VRRGWEGATGETARGRDDNMSGQSPVRKSEGEEGEKRVVLSDGSSGGGGGIGGKHKKKKQQIFVVGLLCLKGVM